MADRERKEIVIEMKADLKDLLTNLKKMPNVTAKEARQMVNSLEKEFRAANKAAKAAAKAQSRSFKEVEKSAKRAGNSIKGLRRQSRELGGSFNAMGDVLTEVNPEMAQFAMGAEVAGDGFRAFSRMLATGNPILIGIVAAIVAATAAYTAFTAKARANEDSQKQLEKVLSDTNAKIREQEQVADAAADAMFAHANAANEAALEYQVLNGLLSDSELTQLKLEKRAGDITDKVIEDGKKRERALKTTIDLNKTANRGLKQRAKFLEDSGQAFKKEASGIGVSVKMQSDYASIQRELKVNTKAIQLAEEDLNQALEENETLAKAAGKRFLENASKAQKLRDKRKRDEEARRERLKNEREAEKARNEEIRNQRKELERIKKIDDEISASRERAAQSIEAIEFQNAKSRIDRIEDQKERAKEAFDLELSQFDKRKKGLEQEKERLSAIATTKEQEIAANEAIAQTQSEINALEEQKGFLILENMKKMDALNKKIILQQITYAQGAVSTFGKVAAGISETIGNLSKNQKQAALTQFRISQGVNIAEIAMETAKNVVKVFPDPILSTLAIALGAAQAAAVATQSPPEFHMGGLLNKGPDTQVITALKGEAILDRSTVREIGGQRGLQRLKEGGNANQEVIVRTPFKHFDNYSKVSIKRGGALSRLQRTRSIGVY